MRHTCYKAVENRVLALAGIKPADRTAEMRVLLNGYINTAAKLAWEFYWWPELMRSELRYYRNPYSAVTGYVAGNQIYYPTTGLYYTALQATTGNLPTNTTYWAVASDLDAYIELEQAGMTALGEIRGVFVDDPMTTERPRRIRSTLGENGVHLLESSLPASAYVLYRLRPNLYSGDDYDAAAPYAAGDAMYYASTGGAFGFDGDYWTCLSATSAGESPESAPDKWARVELPSWLSTAVANRAYAEQLITDGAPQDFRDRAASFADGMLMQAVHLFVGQQRQSLGRVG